jgi:hypothetical protein
MSPQTFRKDDFRYDPDPDVYICPAGETLSPNHEGKLRDLKKIDYSKTNIPLAFEALINWLSETAATLIHNGCGAIDVRCVGINALPARTDEGHKRRRTPTTMKKY